MLFQFEDILHIKDMKTGYIILLMLSLLLGGCIQSTPSRIRKRTEPARANTTVTATNQSIRTQTPTVLNSSHIFYIHRPLSERLLEKIDPEILSKYEGSYTNDDLLSQRDQSTVIKLHSGWLVQGKDLPSARVSIKQNPQTGEYLFQGGELEIPTVGVGVIYAKDSASGETQTFLNWQRDF